MQVTLLYKLMNTKGLIRRERLSKGFYGEIRAIVALLGRLRASLVFCLWGEYMSGYPASNHTVVFRHSNQK